MPQQFTKYNFKVSVEDTQQSLCVCVYIYTCTHINTYVHIHIYVPIYWEGKCIQFRALPCQDVYTAAIDGKSFSSDEAPPQTFLSHLPEQNKFPFWAHCLHR